MNYSRRRAPQGYLFHCVCAPLFTAGAPAGRCVTALDALERMEILSTRPPRAPRRNTRADSVHVCSFVGCE